MQWPVGCSPVLTYLKAGLLCGGGGGGGGGGGSGSQHIAMLPV